MSNPTLELLVDLLVEALLRPKQRKECISRLQAAIWKPPYTDFAPWIQEIPGDLAYDLEFFEPDVELRREDAVYFGDEQAEEKIRAALSKLRNGGVSVPAF